MTCRWCGKGVEQRGHKARLFCNASCRNKAWQRQSRERLRQEQEKALREAQTERDRQVRWHLAEAMRVLGEERDHS